MDKDIVVSSEKVSKKYCKSLKRSMIYGTMDIGRNMIGLGSHSDTLRKDEFWAVNDVSFEMKRGEVLGLIGPNGSGKTTLLKLINGIFWPDKGKISVRGRVGALIAVGAGFHPLLTGRENIYINGAILGMSKKEIDKNFDSIVDFADIGDFLDAPVKHYSSGMFVRLGFAVAIHCEPDVLLVDEILAVGDAAFQSKCLAKIADFMNEGVSIILVSHNVDTIRHICKKGLFLLNGKVKELGDSHAVVSDYLKLIYQEEKEKMKEELKSINGELPLPVVKRKGLIQGVHFFGVKNSRVDHLEIGDPLRITIEYEAFETIEAPVFAIHFYSNTILYTSFISNANDLGLTKIKGKGAVSLLLPQVFLPAGMYRVSAVLSQGVEFNHIDWHAESYFIQINNKANCLGLVALPHKWCVDGEL